MLKPQSQTVRRPDRSLALILVVAWSLAAGPLAEAESEAERAWRAHATASILVDELRTHAAFLADDTLEGREAGSRGGHAAGGYLVDQLRAFGLQPAGESGFYQPFGRGYRNVLALVEGSDPQLRDEAILIGAHYDHVGYGNASNSYGPTGYIHNGADDNASGTSGLLEIAQAFAELPAAPRRSILIAFWDAEETGLLGSQHWVSEPTWPLKDVALTINLDMIGKLRKQSLEVIGCRTGPGLRRLVSEQTPGLELLLDFSWELKADSDHWNFIQQSIPTLMLHTGLHADYHRPSDDLERLNLPGIEEVSRLVFLVAAAAADRDELPEFRRAARRETPFTRMGLERPLEDLPSRLGAAWLPATDAQPHPVVRRVKPGGPAAQAGLQAGDVLEAIEGREVVAGSPLRSWILTATSPVHLRIARPGEEAPREIAVELAGDPVLLGASWRADDAEPGALKIVRVVPASAADLAGLKLLDRIYRVDGQSFADGDAFRALVLSGGREHRLQVERAGRLLELQLVLPEPLK